MISGRAILSLVAGILGMAAVLTAVGRAGMASSPRAEADALPPCTRAMGEAWTELQVHAHENLVPGHTYLLGVDRSPSNAALADAQLEAAVEFSAGLPASDGFGIFFVTDRSDRSSTPDFPLEPPHTTVDVFADSLPCGDCRAQSLFEQRCIEQVEAALRDQRSAVERERAAALEAVRRARTERLREWSERTQRWWPEPGTSLVRFFAKLADLPLVRRHPERVTVVLLSDLEEARTEDVRALRRGELRRSPEGCPAGNPLPEALSGVRVVLLQTIVDGVDAQRWAERWTTLLRCRGARVERYRYADASSFAQALAPTP